MSLLLQEKMRTEQVSAEFIFSQTEVLEQHMLMDRFLKSPIVFTPFMINREAYRQFEMSTAECGVICDSTNKPIAIIMRDRFYRSIGAVYGPSLYFRRPVSTLADAHPLIVDKAVSLQTIIDQAVERDESHFYDCVIITDNERLVGILTCADLLAISRLLQQQALRSQIAIAQGTKQMLGQIDESCKEVLSATTNGVTVSTLMIDSTLDGKRELQKVQNTFSKHVDMIKTQTLQIKTLEECMKSVGSIVSMIRDLADQANLLAVNATIEAARAGENGKGFSVVAEEMRKLAMQTKERAKEIGAYSNEMMESVHQTVALAEAGEQETAASLHHIVQTASVFETLFKQVSDSKKSMEEIHRYAEAAGQEGNHVLTTIERLIINMEEIG